MEVRTPLNITATIPELDNKKSLHSPTFHQLSIKIYWCVGGVEPAVKVLCMSPRVLGALKVGEQLLKLRRREKNTRRPQSTRPVFPFAIHDVFKYIYIYIKDTLSTLHGGSGRLFPVWRRQRFKANKLRCSPSPPPNRLSPHNLCVSIKTSFSSFCKKANEEVKGGGG